MDILKKNKNITLLTLQKLCRILGCTPNDAAQFTENNECCYGCEKQAAYFICEFFCVVHTLQRKDIQ